MTSKRLAKIRRTLEALRTHLGTIRSNELVSIARSLGRSEFNRGKEPTYVRAGWFPLSIPNHGGRDLATGTAASIVNQLLEDLEALALEVAEEEEKVEAETEEDNEEDDDG